MKRFLTKQFIHLKNIIIPRPDPNEDNDNNNKHQQALILNILLAFSLFSFFIINIIRFIDRWVYNQKTGLPIYITLTIFLFFIFLFWLSRQGWLKTAAVLFITVFTLPMIYSFLTWGADLPAALILAVLVIVLSGILLGAKPIFISTFLISAFLIILSQQQSSGNIPVESYWRASPIQVGDAIAHSVLLLIISSVAWIFCREINKSLKRARLSEKLLKEERDSLEITVEKRTKELLNLETEKITQLYRFAEFGRLSSGIFHDLINPLSAVSLNLEQIQTETDNKIMSAKLYLDQALKATHKMENLIASIKKQINRENSITLFSINQEIAESLEILAYKARRAQVEINFPRTNSIELRGDALKFGQIIVNLLANAIEACEVTDQKKVVILLLEHSSDINIIIKDSGTGISSENLQKIFKPFFSTKKIQGQGLGIGLAMTKEIIERDFNGTIEVTSELNHGTKFLIKLPKKY